MNNFVSVDPCELDGNFWKKIGKEWILLSVKDRDGKVNAMTASWGCIGVLWNKNVAVCLIRPQRYTYGLVENSDSIAFNFFNGNCKDVLGYCGKYSGRDIDKISECGLTTVFDRDIVYFNEASLVLTGRKIYLGDIEESGFIDRKIISDFYQENDYHRVYVCEITNAFIKSTDEFRK